MNSLAAGSRSVNGYSFAEDSNKLSEVIASVFCGAGVESRDIMAQTGHKSETVMRGYGQDAGLGATAAVKAAFREE